MLYAIDFLRAFFVVMFSMNLGVLLTWTDRRQGALTQDRVGPNRAVIWLPTRLVQGVLVMGAVGSAVAALGIAKLLMPEGAGASPGFGAALVFGQLGLFLSWVTLTSIAARVGDRGKRNSFDAAVGAIAEGLGGARFIALVGMLVQLALFIVMAGTAGSALGETVRQAAFSGGAALFVFASIGGSAYAAMSLHDEPRVGLRLAGLLHPAADGLKTLFKEDFIPPRADRLLHSLAPFMTFFPALVVLGVVPFGDTLCFDTPREEFTWRSLSTLMSSVEPGTACPAGATAIKLQALDLNVGVLYFFAVAGTGVVGAALAGWSSDNKFSLLGGLRAASQMVSYEVAFGLTLIGSLMVYGTIRIDEMVQWQANNAWGIFVQPFAFFLFFAAAVAESKRIPFDLPEGESEIVAGYNTEYAGMKFAMLFFSEYIAVVSASALMVALFFGGWHLPFFDRDAVRISIGETVYFEQAVSHGVLVLLGFLTFIGKTVVVCVVQLGIRWTLPRFRYDQLMRLGWRKLLPLSLTNILLTGLVILFLQGAGPLVLQAARVLADLSMLLLALLGVFAFVAAIWFFMQAPQKKRLLASTAAQYAAARGGTIRTPMEA